MIDQGSSEQNIIIGVEEDDLSTAIKAIYNAFIRRATSRSGSLESMKPTAILMRAG